MNLHKQAAEKEQNTGEDSACIAASSSWPYAEATPSAAFTC
jgi:hypothetical protein